MNHEELKTLEQLRKDKDMAQIDVAALAGISHVSYLRAEHGTKAITRYTAEAICRVLGVSIEQVRDLKLSTHVYHRRKNNNYAEKL